MPIKFSLHRHEISALRRILCKYLENSIIWKCVSCLARSWSYCIIFNLDFPFLGKLPTVTRLVFPALYRRMRNTNFRSSATFIGFTR